METRSLKNGKISLLGFGLMRLPCKGGNHGDVDMDKGFEMVDYALSKGVNYFDSAWMYHNGNSENFAGAALSRHDRSSYLLATKMPLAMLKAEEEVEKIFAEQLKKCRVEYFDFYLLHNINQLYVKTAENFRVYEKLMEKKKQGFIKKIGFSFHDRPELMQAMVDRYDWDFVQIQLNYVDWELQQAGKLYEILEKKNIPVNIMEPVRGGALAVLPGSGEAVFKAANSAASPASWALRYAASLPGVQVVLSGMSTLEQVKDNVAAMSPFKPLTDEEREVIGKVIAEYRRASAIPCTNCRYCMDCPAGVEIPKTLATYNDYQRALSENHPMSGMVFEMQYNLLKKEEQAASCIECGECQKKCPQHIEIPRWIKAAAGLHEQLRVKH